MTWIKLIRRQSTEFYCQNFIFYFPSCQSFLFLPSAHVLYPVFTAEKSKVNQTAITFDPGGKDVQVQIILILYKYSWLCKRSVMFL